MKERTDFFLPLSPLSTFSNLAKRNVRRGSSYGGGGFKSEKERNSKRKEEKETKLTRTRERSDEKMEKDLSLLHDYDYDDRFSFFDLLEGEKEEKKRCE